MQIMDETHNLRPFNILQTTSSYKMDIEENKLSELTMALELQFTVF
jgi:hypothetical protein